MRHSESCLSDLTTFQHFENRGEDAKDLAKSLLHWAGHSEFKQHELELMQASIDCQKAYMLVQRIILSKFLVGG